MKQKNCEICKQKFVLAKQASLKRTRYCPDCRVEGQLRQQKVYVAKNKEKILAYQRDWQKNNPERRKKSFAKYRAANLELCRERTRLNQIKLNDKKRFGGNRTKVLERDSYTCQKCGKDISRPYSAVVHHKDRNKKNNLMSNLESLCNRCHVYHHYHQGHYPIQGAPS